jgi:hypothetical protein
VEAEKTDISKQRLSKHVPEATDKRTTIDKLQEEVFSMRPVSKLYRKDQQQLLEAATKQRVREDIADW